MMAKHPIQPIEVDDKGTPRFKQNVIVRYLLDNGGIDMNRIAELDFSRDDQIQFAQLIGYSIGGFSELSYVDDDTYEAATKVHELGVAEDKARIDCLEAKLAAVREHVRNAAVELFRIHEDDLHT